MKKTLLFLFLSTSLSLQGQLGNTAFKQINSVQVMLETIYADLGSMSSRYSMATQNNAAVKQMKKIEKLVPLVNSLYKNVQQLRKDYASDANFATQTAYAAKQMGPVYAGTNDIKSLNEVYRSSFENSSRGKLVRKFKEQRSRLMTALLNCQNVLSQLAAHENRQNKN